MTKSQQEISKAIRALRNKRYRDKKKNALKIFSDEIWSLFPKTGLIKMKREQLSNPNVNYGGHWSSLNFEELPENPTFPPGTKSMGIRYENEHSVAYRGRDTCTFSQKHKDFLDKIAFTLQQQFPNELPLEAYEYMRVNLVVGAPTRRHTDTLRGATPNFFLSDDPKFCLKILNYPNYSESVFEYQETYYMAQRESTEERRQRRAAAANAEGGAGDENGGGNENVPAAEIRGGGKDGNDGSIQAITLTDGRPRFVTLPVSILNDVKPVGDLKDYKIVGIKGDKIQVLPSKYSVHFTTDTLELKTWEEVLAHAKGNPVEKPQKLYSYKTGGTGKFVKFYGWRNSHCWLPGTSCDNRRIHVFFRPVREETSAARLRTRTINGTKVPINYTIL